MLQYEIVESNGSRDSSEEAANQWIRSLEAVRLMARGTSINSSWSLGLANNNIQIVCFTTIFHGFKVSSSSNKDAC
jgi:hypothetical protein